LWKKFMKDEELETMNPKDDEIRSFRDHVAELTQTVSQLALPPSQEEARAKSGWQFWRRD